MNPETLTPLQRTFLALEETRARLEALEQAQREPIAIVGLGCRTPGGGKSPKALWALLREGRDTVGPIPTDRWDAERAYSSDPDAPGRSVTRDGGFLEDAAGFDAELFGIAPREAEAMDPQQRLVLEVAWEALENAALAPDRLHESRTGVYLGIASNDYLHLLLRAGDPDLIGPHFMSGIGHSIASGRVSYLLGLQGPSLSIDTACSSSLVAVHLACQSLRSGECDAALAGGVNLMLSPDIASAYSRSRMISPDGRCKAFDADANGIVRGEGCGIIVLRRLSDALARQDRILAVIRGSAVNQDGPSSSLTAPNGPSQEAVIRDALAFARITPDQVGYLEAHGTGTPLGDPLEIGAIGNVFAGHRAGDPLLIGSAKTNFGHLEAAAGIVGLIKVVLSLQHREVPPHLHFRTPSPHIPWDELPIRIPTAVTPWPERSGSRIAGVSSFGFSGTNAHVVVEQAPAPVAFPAEAERPLQVLTLSARTEPALRAMAADIAEAIVGATDADLGDIAYTLNTGRAMLSERAVIRAGSVPEARNRLTLLANGGEDPAITRRRVPAGARPRVAFLFTGQGAQYAGMGRELYNSSAVFRAAFDQCADLFDQELPRPLREVTFEVNPELPINQTGFAQPALFSLEYALTELWKSWGVTPVAVVGHSIGEVTAACVAGILSLPDAVRLVAARGRRMQALPAGGGMRTVFAQLTAVEARLASHRGLEIAAVNAPDHVVVAGPLSALDALGEELQAAGIRSKPLVVSHAFHSALMEPAQALFGGDLAGIEFAPPTMRVVSNVTGALADGVMGSADYWRDQIRKPVLFAKCMDTLATQRCDIMLELGPSPVLTSLGQQCLGADAATWCASLRSGRGDWEQLLDAVQAMYLRGVAIDWERFDREKHRNKQDLPTYPFQRGKLWFRARRGFPIERDDPSVHPLLGRRVSSPLPQAQFESRLSADTPGFIRDHFVGGVVLLPGAAYLEMGMAAARDLFGSAVNRIDNVAFREAMIFGDSESRTVQTIVDPIHEGSAAFRIQSLRENGESWTLHAEGRIQLEASPPLPTNLPEQSPGGGATIEPGAFYETQRARGYEFGPRFRGVQSIQAGDGTAIGKVELPETPEEAARYLAHPALMDACFQVSGGALPETSLSNLYVPVSARRFTIWRPLGVECTSQVILKPGRGDAVHEVDVQIFGPDGILSARVEGLDFQRTSAEALWRIGNRHLANDEYEIRWISSPLSPAGSASAAGLARHAVARLSELSAEHGLEAADALLTRLETLSADWTEGILAEVGWNPTPGETDSFTAIASRLGIVPAHERLFRRLLEIYAEGGGASCNDGQVTAHRKPGRQDNAGTLKSLGRQHPDSAELALLQGTVPGFPDALRGKCDPLQLLFPNGSTETAERLYTSSPTARLYNSMMADAFEAILRSAPSDRPLRVLEIGGGTGGTTSHVLPRIGNRAVEYTFTDLGDSFVMRARRNFADYRGLHFRTLDIEQSPAQQGLDARFDVIIASNVLHATTRMRQTVENVRGLLADGGTLLLLEITAPQRWFDLTVGLTEGWWKFADPDLRSRYTTLSREQWKVILEGSGLEVASVIPEDASSWALQRQQIFIGRAPAQATPDEGHKGWLVLEDNGGIAAQLAGVLRSQGSGCTVVGSSSESDLVLPANVASLEGHRGILREAKRRLGRFDVVDLRWLDTPGWSVATPTLEVLKPGVEATLGLVQAMLQECADRPARLVTITRGAQPADQSSPLAPFQAAAWGIGRTILLEHPELRPVHIDLDPASDSEETRRLVDELQVETAGAQVAYREGQRRVARLTRQSATRRIAEPGTPGGNTTLVPTERGLLENLTWVSCDRRDPGPGEVEIQVTATSLNFRDVLNALGLYPGDPGPLGGECAGFITRLGPGVTSLNPGDRVVTTVPGAFSQFVVNRADLVIRVPSRLSCTEAAALPFGYLTASLALHKLARLQRGESVLIHSAAGGVGLAAVRLAQRIGANVFATAGSPAKRAFLRANGVTHVFDSRTTEFSDAILRSTGGRGVQVVLNSLSGDAIAASVATLASGGRFVEIGKRGIWSAEEMARAGRAIQYSVLDVGEVLKTEPEAFGASMGELFREVEDQSLPTLPVTVFPLGRVIDAFRHMMQARQIGKIVVTHEELRSGPRVRPDGTYLIAGGFSGLGLLAARWLAHQGARHIVLIGRRGITEEAEPVLAELRQTGVTVHPAALDIADEPGLSELLRRVRTQSPPVRGVLHAAGVLDDGAIVSQDWARFARVLGPKVAGVRALDRLTATDPLDWLLIFSSAASLLGSAGQSNHAAANTVLDVLAHERRRLGHPAQAINWGPWSSVGAASGATLQARLETLGLRAVSPEEGLAHLDAMMQDGSPQIGAMSVEWDRWIQQRGNSGLQEYLADIEQPLTRSRSVAAAPHTSSRSLRDQLAAAPIGRKPIVLRTFLREAVRRTLGLPESSPLDDRVPLGDMGLDSLLAVELRNTLSKETGTSLPASLLFDHPNLEALSDHLGSVIFGLDHSSTTPPNPDSPPTDDLLAAIERMSDDEVDRMLTGGSRG